MRGEKKEDATTLLRKHLDGRDFDFFYDTFAEDWQFSEDAKDFEKVKFKQVRKKDRSSGRVRRALNAVMNPNDLTYSLNEISSY